MNNTHDNDDDEEDDNDEDLWPVAGKWVGVAGVVG